MSSLTPNRHMARELAMKYLYQCEREKIFYFNEANFLNFDQYFAHDVLAKAYLRELVESAFIKNVEIERLITLASEHWSLSRICSVDRCVLRVAITELLEKKIPKKIVINEAIDLGKLFGTEQSARFLNGVLDRIARELESQVVVGAGDDVVGVTHAKLCFSN